jgi:hypothetical protein
VAEPPVRPAQVQGDAVPRKAACRPYVLPAESFPASFRSSLTQHIAYLADPPEDDDAPLKGLRPTTLRLREFQFRQMASALVHRGVSSEEIATIGALAQRENVDLICDSFIERGRDNPTVRWNKRTTRKNEDAYGRYLAWLHREGMLIEVEAVTNRITPERVTKYVATLKTHLSPVSVGMVIAALIAAAKALAPSSDWSWLSRRSARLRFKATPSREKRHASSIRWICTALANGSWTPPIGARV